jgi:hypothetical protein
VVWTSGHALAPAPAGRVGAGGPAAAPRIGADAEAGEADPDAGEAGVVLGPAARRELAAALRSRFTRNLATLGPLLTGAAAAGVLNRRSTVTLGHAVARDLGLRR